jgi:hypothetical protein
MDIWRDLIEMRKKNAGENSQIKNKDKDNTPFRCNAYRGDSGGGIRFVYKK